MEKMRFEGKVVIVTGASSGIGRSTARLFAMEGAKVVAAARRLKRLEDLRDKVAAENAPASSCRSRRTARSGADRRHV
ncbi:MAG: SDR family NAD(P)-dependent oxidoreductase [Oscillospiraceae bacterium]